MNGYKFGIRYLKIPKDIGIGIGFVFYDEKALVISFAMWEIYIGKVYNDVEEC